MRTKLGILGLASQKNKFTKATKINPNQPTKQTKRPTTNQTKTPSPNPNETKKNPKPVFYTERAVPHSIN